MQTDVAIMTQHHRGNLASSIQDRHEEVNKWDILPPLSDFKSKRAFFTAYTKFWKIVFCAFCHRHDILSIN